MDLVKSSPDGTEHPLMSVKEAARWLRISEFTIYSWALSRRIPHYKIGKRVMLSPVEVKRWIEQHRIAEAG